MLWLFSAVALADFLHIAPGSSYSSQRAGRILYDFSRNQIVLAFPTNLPNLNAFGFHEPLPPTFDPTRVVLVKYAAQPEGRLLFAVQPPIHESPVHWCLAADRSGSIYTAGRLERNEYLPTHYTAAKPVPAQEGVTVIHRPLFIKMSDLMVMKWSSQGQLQWIRPFPGTAVCTPDSVAVDNEGSIFVAGTFKGRLPLDCTQADREFDTSTWDLFLMKLNREGACEWARHFTGAESTLPISAHCDPDGNCIVTGGFERRLRMTGGTSFAQLNGRGNWDLFLAKFSPAGDLVWARSDGGPANEYGNRVIVDAVGWSYVYGRYGTNAVFGSGENTLTLECREEADQMVACYDEEGAFVTALRLGGRGGTMDPEFTTVLDEFDNRYIVLPGTIPSKKRSSKPIASKADSSNHAAMLAPAASTLNGGTSSATPSFRKVTRVAPDALEITLVSPDIREWLVETTRDFRQWTVLSTNAAIAGKLLIHDPRGREAPALFYRVRPLLSVQSRSVDTR